MSMNKEDEVFRRRVAIDWWVRLDAGGLSKAELMAFRTWLATDPANEAEFETLCDVWEDLDRLRPGLQTAPRRPARRPWYAAGAALAILLVFFLSFDEVSIWFRSDFSTGIGEIKTFVLEDGSRVELNADSAIARDFSGRIRELVLLKGEALFDVAGDPSRPFTVGTAGGKTTALGTLFDIATDKLGTQITGLAHQVEVSAQGVTVVVKPAEQTAYGPQLPLLSPYSIDPDSATAWRRGKLIFQDKPLGEVLAALGHYHHGYVFAASSLRDRRITGVFSAAHPLEAIRAIELSLGLKAAYLGDYLIWLH